MVECFSQVVPLLFDTTNIIAVALQRKVLILFKLLYILARFQDLFFTIHKKVQSKQRHLLITDLNLHIFLFQNAQYATIK